MCSDMWHVEGDSIHHRWDNGKEFIECVKKILPNIELPIYVEPNGYIHLTDIPSLPMYGWSTDDFGRFVAIIDHELIFQRMIKGHQLIYGTIVDEHSVFKTSVDNKKLGDVIDNIFYYMYTNVKCTRN